MSASPEGHEPSDYSDDDLHTILRRGNQDDRLVGWASAELERRRNAHWEPRVDRITWAERWAAAAAAISAVGSLITAVVR